MAEKLTPAKVEEAVKHYENIQSGKTPILKTDKEKTTEHITDMHKYLKKKQLQKQEMMLIVSKIVLKVLLRI